MEETPQGALKIPEERFWLKQSGLSGIYLFFVVAFLHSGPNLPLMLVLGSTLLILSLITEGHYLLDPRRREILHQTALLGRLRWTRKVADYSDILDCTLQPQRGDKYRAVLHLRDGCGDSLNLPLASGLASALPHSIESLLEKHRIHRLNPQQRLEQRSWHQNQPEVGCYISVLGCLAPPAIGLAMALCELFVPHLHLGPYPILQLFFVFFILGPFCSTGWKFVPERNLFQEYFQLFGVRLPWRTNTLTGCWAELIDLHTSQAAPPLVARHQLALRTSRGRSLPLETFADPVEAEEARRLLQEQLDRP